MSSKSGEDIFHTMKVPSDGWYMAVGRDGHGRVPAASYDGVVVPVPLAAGAEYRLKDGEQLLPLDAASQRWMNKMCADVLPALWEASRSLFSTP